jgi:hypothetical protein
MDLSSLNVDVLLYLLKFVEPVDCFNLALSGILKGFENAHEVIDLRQRYSEHFTCDVNGNQFSNCLGSSVLELNWDYVVVECANWKSGESASINKQEMWQAVC